MAINAQENSLFEIDRELDLLLDEIQEETEEGSEKIRAELVQKFHEFCQAHTTKVDRIGHFLSLMEARASYCRTQATRLTERARSAENKIERTKSMVLYYLRSRDLRKIEGQEFTLCAHKNSQDSVVISDEPSVPLVLREIEAKIPGRFWQALLSILSEEDAKELKSCIRQTKPSHEAIRNAAAIEESIPGVEIRRGFHLRIA